MPFRLPGKSSPARLKYCCIIGVCCAFIAARNRARGQFQPTRRRRASRSLLISGMIGGRALARLVHFADNTQLAQPTDPAATTSGPRRSAPGPNSLNPATKRILGAAVRIVLALLLVGILAFLYFKSQSGALRLQPQIGTYLRQLRDIDVGWTREMAAVRSDPVSAEAALPRRPQPVAAGPGPPDCRHGDARQRQSERRGCGSAPGLPGKAEPGRGVRAAGRSSAQGAAGRPLADRVPAPNCLTGSKRRRRPSCAPGWRLWTASWSLWARSCCACMSSPIRACARRSKRPLRRWGARPRGFPRRCARRWSGSPNRSR